MNKTQTFWLTILRVLIGWHFLYEGMVKLLNPNWSSVGYLLDSQGWFKGIFYWMASDPAILRAVDFLNIWGLILVGLALILGLFTRTALYGGIVLLSMYYLSHPPFVGLTYDLPAGGSFLFVDKTLIELAAMVVLSVFSQSWKVGLDMLIFKKISS